VSTCIVSIINNLKSSLRKWLLKKGRIDYFVYLLIGIYIVVFSYYTMLRHFAFLTSAWNLGGVEQTFWTTLFDGKLFYGTLEIVYNPQGTPFATHFSPIVFLVLPLYAIYPEAGFFLILQTCALALGALPLYWLVRDEFNSKISGLAFVVLYLLAPSLHSANAVDFGWECLLPAFFLFAIYYLKKEKYVKFFVFVILALMTLEFVPLIVISIGLYGLWSSRKSLLASIRLRNRGLLKNKRIIFSFFTIALAIVWFFIALVVKSYSNPYTSPIPTSIHGTLGNSPIEITLNTIFNPLNAIQLMFSSWGDKFLYIIFLFGPLAFMSFLDPPSLIMTLPWLFFSFLSNCWLYYSINHNYSLFVLPFVFVSAIYGLKRLTQIGGGVNASVLKKSLLLTMTCTIIFVATFSPIFRPWPTVTEHNRLMNEMINLIPDNSSVLTQNDIFPHVCHRSNVYVGAYNTSKNIDYNKWIPPSFLFTEYILIDTKSHWYTAPLPNPPLSVIVPKLVKGDDYGLLASADGILLFKKRYVGEPVLFVPIPAVIFNYENLNISEGRIEVDPTASSQKVLVHKVEDPPGTFWYGPFVNLLPIKYEVTFRLKTSSNKVNFILTIDISSECGATILTSKDIYGTDFEQANEWQNFTLRLALQEPKELVEFRGIYMGNTTNVYLDYVKVDQVNF
jgi:uncharacterized membrane protein